MTQNVSVRKKGEIRAKKGEVLELPACIREYQRIKRKDYATDLRLREQAIEYILYRAMQGDKLEDVAKDVRMSAPTLHRTLYKYAEDEWKEVQVSRMQAKYDAALESFEKSEGILEITRTKELVKSLQWQLERLNRRLYGADTPKDAVGRITINLNMGEPSGPVVSVQEQRDDDIM